MYYPPLEYDSYHDRYTVHVIIDLELVALGSIVGHEESVADVSEVSDTVVCRGRGAVVKGVGCVCLSVTALHTTAQLYISEGIEEWA